MLALLNEQQLKETAESYKQFTLYQLQLEQQHRRSSLFISDHPEEHWLGILSSHFDPGNAQYILEGLIENEEQLFILDDILEWYHEESEEDYWDSYHKPTGSRFEITEAAVARAKDNGELSPDALAFLETHDPYQASRYRHIYTSWLHNEELTAVISESYEDSREYDQCNGVILHQSNNQLLIAAGA
jgi:hypothetical protein